MRKQHERTSERIFTIDAGWPHVALFVRSGALQNFTSEDYCFVRSGYNIYFVSDHGDIIKIVEAQFDLNLINQLPPSVLDENPFDSLGDVDRFLAVTSENF